MKISNHVISTCVNIDSYDCRSRGVSRFADAIPFTMELYNIFTDRIYNCLNNSFPLNKEFLDKDNINTF